LGGSGPSASPIEQIDYADEGNPDDQFAEYCP
jgi:hypothetical protein